MKENDYFLNAMNNTNFSNLDFYNVGLNAENTSMETRDTYKKLDYVQNSALFQTDGKFDEQKFNNFYDASLIGYNRLCQDDNAKEIAKSFTYFKGNIFEPINQRNLNPEFLIQEKVINPDRQKISMWGVNSKSAPTMSAREIAQTQMVWDYEKNEWTDSPNDQGFFGDFFNTKVLATYDEDGEHEDPLTGQMVQHKKGQKKLNENGTYYYETLGDRDIYGKDVLSKFDVITRDGSTFNKYDFFDSDDLKKDLTGSIVKQIVKAAPAFIPFVSPWYIGARVALETSDLLSKLGKMAFGSDNKTLSAIEGFNKSLQMSNSDYAYQHPWSMENMLNMGADVFTQLAEQRWLFEYAPYLIKGKLGFDAKAQKKFTDTIRNQKLDELSGQLRKFNKNSQEILNASAIHKAYATAEANQALENVLKDSYKIGSYISKAYMTGITVADSYGEAKEAGASDLEAALFTLAYAAGEYAVLNTELGEWILPELRIEKQKIRQAVKTLTHSNPQPPSSATASVKRAWAQRLFDKTKQWFNGEIGELHSMPVHMLSNALGEGFEEVSEEMLQDFSKALANGAFYLSGSKTHLRPTWEDENNKFSYKQFITGTLNDYALNFVGGFIGGGIGNIMPTYREALNVKKMKNTDEAYKTLLYYIREGKANEIKDVARKMTLGDKNNSLQIDGTGFVTGDKTNNQDYIAKQEFNKYIDKLEKIINLEPNVKDQYGAKMDLVMKDVRFLHLLESKVAQEYLGQYHDKIVDLVSKVEALNIAQQSETDNEKKNETQLDQDKINELNKEINVLRKEVEEYVDGTQSKEFVRDAIFEMEHGISDSYIPTNILQYVTLREAADGQTRPISQIDDVTMQKYKEEWQALNQAGDEGLKIHEKRLLFDKYNTLLSNALRNHIQKYMDIENGDNFVKNFEQDVLNAQNVINGIQHTYGDTAMEMGRFNVLYSTNDGDTRNDNYNGSKDVVSKRVSLATQFVDTIKDLNIQQNYLKAINALSKISNDENLNPDDIQTLSKYSEVNTESNYAQYNLIFKKFVNDLLQNNVNDIIAEIKDQPFLRHSTREYMSDFIQEFAEDDHLKQQYMSAINSVKYTPIETFLDAEQVSLKDDSIKVSQLMSALENQAYKTSMNGNLAEFGYDDSYEEAIKHTEDLIKIAMSHLSAARTDDFNYDKPFGYNQTVNELEGNDNLVTIDINQHNVLAQDLYKLSKDLSMYKRLVELNNNTLFSKQPKIASKSLQKTIQSLKLMISTDVDIPDDWKDREKLCKGIEDLYNSEELSSLVQEDKQFNDDDLIKLRTLRLKLNDIIYNFFQANKDKKSNEISNLIKILCSNIYQRDPRIMLNSHGASFSNNEYNTNTIQTVISFIAANASLKLSSFQKAYGSVLENETKFQHTEGGENLLYHEIAFSTNEDFWDSCANGINDFILSVNDSKFALTTATFLNAPGSKLDNHNSIKSSHTFLGQGTAGVGKSSANIVLYLKILNSLGKSITSKIFLVGKTLDDAKKWRNNLVKDTGIDEKNFHVFGQQEYMDYINDKRPEKTPNGRGYTYDKQVVDTQLIQDENKVWHYANENEMKSLEGPSLVLMDEVTNLSELDLNQHEKYLSNLHVKCIALGDFNQTTVNASFEGEDLFTHLNNFFSTYGLVLPFRSDNTYNSESQQSILNIHNSESLTQTLQDNYSVDNFGELLYDIVERNDEYYDLSYTEDEETGLFGIKVSDVIANDNGNTIDDNSQFAKDVEIMLQTLEPENYITYIYDSNENDESSQSAVYKYLKSKYANDDRIQFVKGSAQGLEGQYYIIEDPSIENYSSSNVAGQFEFYLKDIYTHLSRSKQGTIFIPREFSPGMYQNPFINPAGSTEKKKVGKFKLTEQAKILENIKTSKIISEAIKDFNPGEILISYMSKKAVTESKNSSDDDKIEEEKIIDRTEEKESDLKKNIDNDIKSEDTSLGQIEHDIKTIEIRFGNNMTPELYELKDRLEDKKEIILQKMEEEGEFFGSEVDDGNFESADRELPYVNDDPKKIKGVMHSFNTYDLGCITEEDGGNIIYKVDFNGLNDKLKNKILDYWKNVTSQVQNGNKKLTYNDLVDLAKLNVNVVGIQGLALCGIVKTKVVNGEIILLNPADAIEKYNKIRYALKHNVSSDIEKVLSNVFSGKIGDTSRIQFRCAAQLIARKYKYGKNRPGSIVNIRGRNKEDGGRFFEGRNKRIISVIGFTKDNDETSSMVPIMDVPLYTFPNPMSLLDSYNLRQTWNKFKTSYSKKIDALSAFGIAIQNKTIKDDNGNDVNPTFCRAINCFLADADSTNSNRLSYLKDGKGDFVTSITEQLVTSKESIAINTGIDVVSKEKGANDEFTDEFGYDPTPQYLDELIGRPESDIYISKEAYALEKDLTDNSGKVIIKKGEHFVFASEGKETLKGKSFQELLRLYKDNYGKNNNIIKIIRINAPAVNVGSYVDFLQRLIFEYPKANDSQKNNFKYLGNKSSMFKVARKLLNNKGFINAIKGINGGDPGFQEDKLNALRNAINKIWEIHEKQGVPLVEILVKEPYKSWDADYQEEIYNASGGFTEFNKNKNKTENRHIFPSHKRRKGERMTYGSIIRKELVKLLSKCYSITQKAFDEETWERHVKPTLIAALSSDFSGIYYDLSGGDKISISHDGKQVGYYTLDIDTTQPKIRLKNLSGDEGRIQVCGKIDTNNLFGELNTFYDAIERAADFSKLEDQEATEYHDGKGYKEETSEKKEEEESFESKYNVTKVEGYDDMFAVDINDETKLFIDTATSKAYAKNDKSGRYEQIENKDEINKIIKEVKNIKTSIKTTIKLNESGNVAIFRDTPPDIDSMNNFSKIDTLIDYSLNHSGLTGIELNQEFQGFIVKIAQKIKNNETLITEFYRIVKKDTTGLSRNEEDLYKQAMARIADVLSEKGLTLRVLSHDEKSSNCVFDNITDPSTCLVYNFSTPILTKYDLHKIDDLIRFESDIYGETITKETLVPIDIDGGNIDGIINNTILDAKKLDESEENENEDENEDEGENNSEPSESQKIADAKKFIDIINNNEQAFKVELDKCDQSNPGSRKLYKTFTNQLGNKNIDAEGASSFITYIMRHKFLKEFLTVRGVSEDTIKKYEPKC